MTDLLIREDRDQVAIVTLNRPDKLNAINSDMMDGIFEAVEDLRDRDDLRVLLIRARGNYFTAGIDIRQSKSLKPENHSGDMLALRRNYRRNLHIRFDEMEAIEKPIVMAIHAPCLGVGVEMASSVDFRLASESARFGLPEIDIGVIAGSGGISRFTRLCGIGWSKWLSVAGEQMDARTAQMAGFVQAVWPDKTFEDEVWAFCQRLTTRPADVQGVSKLAVEMAYDLDRTNTRHLDRIVNTPFMMRDNSALVEKAIGKRKK